METSVTPCPPLGFSASAVLEITVHDIPNLTRHIIIHGISNGTDSPLLRRLAEATGNRYVQQ